MAQQDAELVARWAAGDRTALDTLYRQYAPQVWRYGWFRTHSREAAADLVQETFLRVVRSLDRFAGRSSFATWLYAVTRSVAVEHARREALQRRSEPVLLRLAPDCDDPPDPLEARDTRAAVRDAVAALPGAQRDAIILCELSGLSIRQAAETLGWGESRVKVTLFRARRRLRDRLKEYVAEGRLRKAGEGK
jgi:RNA polymerase sigma-70 factor, ECF subfamily